MKINPFYGDFFRNTENKVRRFFGLRPRPRAELEQLLTALWFEDYNLEASALRRLGKFEEEDVEYLFRVVNDERDIPAKPGLLSAQRAVPYYGFSAGEQLAAIRALAETGTPRAKAYLENIFGSREEVQYAPNDMTNMGGGMEYIPHVIGNYPNLRGSIAERIYGTGYYAQENPYRKLSEKEISSTREGRIILEAQKRIIKTSGK